MKVYNILATVIVEDQIENSRITDICNENIETAIMEDFRISNCIIHYELKEIIEYPDPPEIDPNGKHFDKWMNKSQEVIDRIQTKMRNQ